MSWWRRSLSILLGQLAYKFAFGQVRQRALLVYLKTLQAVRRSLIAVIAVFFILQLMVIGFVGTVITALWLWPTDLEVKLYTSLGIFGTFFLLPLIGLCLGFSERTWFKASRAEELLKKSA